MLETAGIERSHQKSVERITGSRRHELPVFQIRRSPRTDFIGGTPVNARL